MKKYSDLSIFSGIKLCLAFFHFPYLVLIAKSEINYCCSKKTTQRWVEFLLKFLKLPLLRSGIITLIAECCIIEITLLFCIWPWVKHRTAHRSNCTLFWGINSCSFKISLYSELSRILREHNDVDFTLWAGMIYSQKWDFWVRM